MSDMQQNFDEQLAGRESELNSRLDSVSHKHETELSGESVHFTLFLSSFNYLR